MDLNTDLFKWPTFYLDLKVVGNGSGCGWLGVVDTHS